MSQKLYVYTLRRFNRHLDEFTSICILSLPYIATNIVNRDKNRLANGCLDVTINSSKVVFIYFLNNFIRKKVVRWKQIMSQISLAI